VRPAARSDLELVVEFNRCMALETEGRELDRAQLARGVARALDDPSRGRYFLAELEGRAAGCLMLTREWSDWRDGWFLWIQSVYTAPEARGRGVYRALHEHVLAAARSEADACGVRLYVERSNARAQAVYERLGMRRTSYLLYEVDFRAEDGVPPARPSPG